MKATIVSGEYPWAVDMKKRGLVLNEQARVFFYTKSQQRRIGRDCVHESGDSRTLNEMGVEYGVVDQPQPLGHLDATLSKDSKSIILEYHNLGDDGGSCRGSSDDAAAGLISLQQSPM